MCRYEVDWSLAGWMMWRWPWATEELRWRLRDKTRKIGKSGESWCLCNWMSVTCSFCLVRCSFGLPTRALGVITCRGVGCHYILCCWVKQKKLRAQLLKIKAQVSSIWAKGCMMDDCVWVIWLDMTIPPGWREIIVDAACDREGNETVTLRKHVTIKTCENGLSNFSVTLRIVPL